MNNNSSLIELIKVYNKRTEEAKNLKFKIDEKKEQAKIQEMLKNFNRATNNNNPEILQFNVGGTKFATYRSTVNKRVKNPNSLNCYEPNLLQALATTITQVEEETSIKKFIFIDRNPKYFSYLLDYLRMANTDEKFELPTGKNELNGLLKEAAYFKMQGLIDLADQFFFEMETKILSTKQVKELRNVCKFGEKLKLSLLYRGSRDGFESQNFHEKCDGFLDTLTIVESEHGKIFGGYVGLAWDQSNRYKNDPNSFIFSLVNKHAKSFMLSYNQNGKSIYCHSSYSATFGSGHDFCIASNANQNRKSYSNLGASYQKLPKPTIFDEFPCGSNLSSLLEAQEFLAGTYNFKISQIEVFQLIFF